MRTPRLGSSRRRVLQQTAAAFWFSVFNVSPAAAQVNGRVRRLSSGVIPFAKNFDDTLQLYLTHSNVHWQVLEESTRLNAEAEWRKLFSRQASRRPRVRSGAKAEYEFLQQPCTHFLIVPFTSNVEGFPMDVRGRSLSAYECGAYECSGPLVPLGEFCGAEFFVSPLDFDWTMVHTHEDFSIGGPYFIRREWVQ